MPRHTLLNVASMDSRFPDDAVIAITSEIDADSGGFDHFISHLELVFLDTEEQDHPDSMQSDHAQQIVDFINSLDTKVETLFVSCNAGVSRSSAIAAAIIRAQGLDDSEIWANLDYSPNIHCYRMVLAAFGIDASDAEEKMRTNEQMRHNRLFGRW